MAAESDNSAHLVMTQRGSWIDQDLLPAAREECLEALQRASEVVGEGVTKMVRGDRQKVWEIYGEEFIATCRDVKTYRQRKEEVKQSRQIE